LAGRKQASPPSVDVSAPVRVADIGADGDGIAEGPDGRTLFLADTLPGELVQPGPLIKRGDGLAGAATILEPSPDRVAPPCRHFGPCGGCTLQHWRDDAYAVWKLARTGAPGPLARTPPGARRRIDLGIRRASTTVLLGLHQRRSTDIVDMHECPILHPDLFALIQALRPVLLRLTGLRKAGEAQINLLETGPDLLLRTDAPLSAADRVLLAGLPAVSRVSWMRMGEREIEPAAMLRPSVITFAGVRTEPPPGAFLQASREGEAAIVAAVLAALPERIKGGIVELFAGCGSLTHALAARAPVTAYEGDQALVAALHRAGNKRVTTRLRDLARQPLTAVDLRGAGTIVLDPPYPGATAQMPALAASGLPIVYVSCNPAALARDARPLVAAGYRAISAAAIDQFLWSTQVETVVAFTKG